MIGISGDPLSSREHILLANIIQNAWSQGQGLDLATLLAQVQQPPMRKLGVLELDAFFPAERPDGLRHEAQRACWPRRRSRRGSPVSRSTSQSMLFTPEGRPRCAIVSIAHLDDEQRQSVTALVLSKLVTWMRRQSGTSDLRALLYMDEVAGYLPPTANPPTKKPIMLLLKQARAFGLGVVLSTQNPVDVDYKALSNAGTWLIGRLQTEQDKARLIDGLSSAAGGVDVKAVGDTISNLGKRQFVLRKAGKDVPEVMTTRWAMSYLRGPLTRDQIPAAMRVGAPAVPRRGRCSCGAGLRCRGTVRSGRRPWRPAAAALAAPAPSSAAAVPVAPAVVTSIPPATAGADESPVMPAIAAGSADGVRRSRGALARGRRRRTRWPAPARRGGGARRPDLRRRHGGRRAGGVRGGADAADAGARPARVRRRRLRRPRPRAGPAGRRCLRAGAGRGEGEDVLDGHAEVARRGARRGRVRRRSSSTPSSRPRRVPARRARSSSRAATRSPTRRRTRR